MNKKGYIIGVIGLVVGVLLFGFVRFAVYKPITTHYHANFGLFVNGVRDNFENFSFYEEVQACNTDGSNDPKTRTHMHKPNNYKAATWGAFFANLGYSLDYKVLTTGDGVFVDGQDGKKLTFTLNGQTVQTIANRVIGDDDVLLVSYGIEDAVAMQTQYRQITHDAAKIDQETDPAACGGAEKLSFGARLKHAMRAAQAKQ
jgi:hypothetical protein